MRQHKCGNIINVLIILRALQTSLENLFVEEKKPSIYLENNNQKIRTIFRAASFYQRIQNNRAAVVPFFATKKMRKRVNRIETSFQLKAKPKKNR